jgi:putative copper resistance protein D
VTTFILVIARTVHFGSAMMLFALPFFILFILRPNLSAEPAGSYPAFCHAMKKWFEVVLCLEAVSGGVWFWIIAAQKCHQSPGHILSAANLNAVLRHTSFGRLWLIRGGIVIALTVVLCFARRRKALLPPRSPLLNGLILTGSGSLLLSLAWAGHVAAGIHHQILHLLAAAPHLLLGAIWPMGLIPMACFLWQINQANGFSPVHREVETLNRFSQTSLVAVLLLVVTGSIDGWLMIGSWQNLLMTTHGRLFLGKMLVVGVMIALGAFCRLHLMPRIREVPFMFRTLERTLWAESGLALVVVLIVAMHT